MSRLSVLAHGSAHWVGGGNNGIHRKPGQHLLPQVVMWLVGGAGAGAVWLERWGWLLVRLWVYLGFGAVAVVGHHPLTFRGRQIHF